MSSDLAGLLHGRRAQKKTRRSGSNGLLCGLLVSNQLGNRPANFAMSGFESLILSPAYAQPIGGLLLRHGAIESPLLNELRIHASPFNGLPCQQTIQLLPS